MSETTNQPESTGTGARDASDRSFDIILYGATGFTGGLVADYLLRNMPEGGSWAVAGRNRTKLDAVAARLAAEMPEVPAPGIVVADTQDTASLAEMARSTRVLITTVGPYLEYGEPLVAACRAGTDYGPDRQPSSSTGCSEYRRAASGAISSMPVASTIRTTWACSTP